MSGDGVFTLTGAPAGTYFVDYYFLDASDSYKPSAEIKTLTLNIALEGDA